MTHLQDSIAVETDLFGHREVKPHFINPCCFGEDFADWLRNEVSPLASRGFAFDAPIQEDYGWGFWATFERDRYWIALSYASDGPTDAPAQWVISVDHQPGLNLIRRFFHRPDAQAFDQLREVIWASLRSNRQIAVLEPSSPS